MKIMKFIVFYYRIILEKSINQQDFNATMTNNEEQSPKIVQQTTDAIKKAKD